MKKNEEAKLVKLLAEVESEKVTDLKNTNKRLLRQIEKLKDTKADLVEDVYKRTTDGP